MALTWGSWTSTINGQRFRLGIDIWYTGDPNSGAVTVWGAYRIASAAPVGDDQTLNLSGSFSGSVGFRNNGGEFEIWRGSKSVATKYGSTTWVGIGGWVTGIYNGLSPSHDTGITIPARAYAAPYAPPAVTASRSSDTRTNLSWTTNYTSASGARPWTGVKVERWDNVSGAYTEVKVLSWDVTSWADTGTVANRYYRYRVRSYNSAGHSGYTYSSYIYNTPADPGSAAVTRSSDTQQNVSWTEAFTGSTYKSWDGVKVERWDNVSNAWSQIAAVAVGTKTYADKGTVANRRYRYRVRSYVSSMNSGYVYSGYINTTPAAPTGVEAAKAVSDINIIWSDTSTDESGFQVWHAANGVWDASPLATVGAGVTSYTHVAPNAAQTHTYRVRSYATETGQTTLYSAYSADSNVVQLQAPPKAPTALAPTGVLDASTPPVLRWKHNPVDTTAQTAYQVQRREVGTSTWNTSPKTASTSALVDTANWVDQFVNGKRYEWQVRTWGQHADPSPWSATATFTASAAPTVTIQSPLEDVPWDVPTLALEWSYYDEEGSAQAEWKATLYSEAGTVLETVQRVGEDTGFTFTRRVADDTTYVVGIQVRDGAGLWSTEEKRTVPVSYALPATPLMEGHYDPERGTVVVAVDNPDEGLETPTTYNEVWRSADQETARLHEVLSSALRDAEARGLATPRRNLAPSPRLTQDVDGTTIADGWAAYSRGAPADGWSVSEAGQRLAGTFTADGQRLGVRLDLDTLEPGGFYTVSLDVAIADPSARYFLYLEQLLPGDVYAYLGEYELTESGRFSTSGVSPTGDAVGPVMLYLWAQGDTAGTTYDVTLDRVQIEAGEEQRPYFDGDTPDGDGVDYTWEGTPNASVSTATDTLVPAARNAFERSWDATAALVAGDVPPNAAVTDYIPAINGANVYRVVAYSDLPSSAAGEPVLVQAVHRTGWVFINAGPNFAQGVRIKHGAQVNQAFSREKVLNRYAGRQYPVETAGDGRSRRVNLAVRLGDGASTIFELEELADLPAPACYRDPSGKRYFVSLGEVSHTHRSVIKDATVQMEQVDHHG